MPPAGPFTPRPPEGAFDAESRVTPTSALTPVVARLFPHGFGFAQAEVLTGPTTRESLHAPSEMASPEGSTTRCLPLQSAHVERVPRLCCRLHGSPSSYEPSPWKPEGLPSDEVCSEERAPRRRHDLATLANTRDRSRKSDRGLRQHRADVGHSAISA